MFRKQTGPQRVHSTTHMYISTFVIDNNNLVPKQFQAPPSLQGKLGGGRGRGGGGKEASDAR